MPPNLSESPKEIRPLNGVLVREKGAREVGSPPVLPRGRVEPPAIEPLPDLFPGQKERDELQDLAAQYDPELVPKIAVYLKHPISEVRAAAVDALVQVGDKSALPILSGVLSGLTSESEEADHVRQAVEFLSLPTADVSP